jgi:hypothetical protein
MRGYLAQVNLSGQSNCVLPPVFQFPRCFDQSVFDTIVKEGGAGVGYEVVIKEGWLVKPL